MSTKYKELPFPGGNLGNWMLVAWLLEKKETKMKKSGEYNLWKGRKVRVFSADQKRDLGIWEYCGAEVVGQDWDNPRRRLFVPKFKQGRRRIRGYECWWIPLSEASKIERQVKRVG